MAATTRPVAGSEGTALLIRAAGWAFGRVALTRLTGVIEALIAGALGAVKGAITEVSPMITLPEPPMTTLP